MGLQIETSGWFGRSGTAGFQLGCAPEPYGPVTLLPGTHATEFVMNVANVEPATTGRVHPGLRRAWGSTFALRPEHGGISNNSFSASCNHCQYIPADVAFHTRTTPPLPPMMDLVRYTVELALQGGPACAAEPEPIYDSAPSLVCAATRVFQTQRDLHWLRHVWPYLRPKIAFILGSLDKNGMWVSRLRSGNSGTQVAGNAWDGVAFGHHDGYVGALAYRALRGAVVLACAANDPALSAECVTAADRLRRVFVPTLYNPKTGWLGSWRSADGKLHDYGFHYITAMAACFGILTPAQARAMLSRLERQRVQTGITDCRYGLPPNFLPVAKADSRNQWYDQPFAYGGLHFPSRADGADTYGIFTNGGLTPVFVSYYLRALSQHGFTRAADQICDQLLASFDCGQFEGSQNGAEGFTLDGLASAYEGTISHSYHVLVAIAQHRRWIPIPDPECWPGEE